MVMLRRAPILLAAVLVGCVSSSMSSSGSSDAGGDVDPLFVGDGGTPASPAAVGHLRGTVFAPNGTMPVAGALLYVTAQKWNALLELLKEQVERVTLPAEAGPVREEAIARRIAILPRNEL